MNVQEAVDALKNNGVLLCQTDTIPGLHARVFSDEGIAKVEEIKGREGKAGFVVLVCDDRMINSIVNEVPAIGWDLIDYASKPTTIIFDDAINVPDKVSGDDGSIAVRLVKEGPIYEVLRKLREPVISTSANISGDPSPRSMNYVSDVVKEKCDAIITEGIAGEGKASSLIRLRNNGEVKILRK